MTFASVNDDKKLITIIAADIIKITSRNCFFWVGLVIFRECLKISGVECLEKQWT